MEVVQEFGKSIGALVSAAVSIDANRDGNISTSEVLSLVLTAAGLAQSQFGTIGNAVEKLSSIEGRNALVDGLKQGFTIPETEKEEVVETWATLIVAVINNAQRTREVF